MLLPVLVGMATHDMGERLPRLFAAGTNPDSANLVIVHMGDVTLRIPRSYFYGLPSHEGHGPDAVDFTLLTLLPDFPLPGPGNAAEFAALGWGRIILIGVYYKGYQLTGSASLHAWYTYSNHAKILNGPFGYLYFRHSGSDILFRGNFDSPTQIISCTPLTGPLAAPSPSCKRIMKVAPDLVVDYSYSRSYLAKAEQIDQKVVEFLNRFHISGPKLQVIP